MKLINHFNFLIGMRLLILLIYGAALFGEVRCIVKAVKCNWNPIGKAEIIYSAGAITGLGVVIGYMNIEDE